MKRSVLQSILLGPRLLIFAPFVVGLGLVYAMRWPWLFAEDKRAFGNIWNRMRIWTFRRY